MHALEVSCFTGTSCSSGLLGNEIDDSECCAIGLSYQAKPGLCCSCSDGMLRLELLHFLFWFCEDPLPTNNYTPVKLAIFQNMSG